MTYRAEIDGLRAIAVLSVILYHAQIVLFGRDWFEGGFIGVDIFFVISGYLITRIILTELEQTNTFSFIKFYERRARRILPMLLVVIAVCIPFAWLNLIPIDLVDFAKSSLSAIGFGSNFFFYFSTTEYGADSALLKPLLHTWSLGVEEQFYIIVPIIILLIWKFARASLLTLLIGMLIMSIQFADLMEVRNSELNFFLPFSRFWELLVGSTVAVIESKFGRSKNPILTQTLPIIGLFLITHSILFFDSKTPHPSFQTLLPTLGVALVLAFCSTEDFVGKLLSLKPMVGVGLISYSLYLWHFPIFSFNRIGSADPSNFDKLEWITASFVLALISYFSIEKVFRNQKIITAKLFSVTLLLFFSGLSCGNLLLILNDGFKNRLPLILSKENLDERVWEVFEQDGEVCYGRETKFCNIENADGLTHVYALGDSHFSSMSPQLVAALGAKFNYLEMNIGGCPFVLNVDRYYEGNPTPQCTSANQESRFQTIKQSPSIILIGGRFPAYLSGKNFDNGEGGYIAGIPETFVSKDGASLGVEFKKTIELLISKGHQVVLVYPIPEVGWHVPNYIFSQINEKAIFEVNENFEILTTSSKVYIERTASTFELFDSIDSLDVYRVYPHSLFCDQTIQERCVTHDYNDVYYADDNHPSSKGSEMIVSLIMEQVEKAEARINEN